MPGDLFLHTNLGLMAENRSRTNTPDEIFFNFLVWLTMGMPKARPTFFTLSTVLVSTLMPSPKSKVSVV